MVKNVERDLKRLFRELKIPLVVFVDDDAGADDVTPGSILAAALGSPEVRAALESVLGLDLDPDNEALSSLVEEAWTKLDDRGRNRTRTLLRADGKEGSDLNRLRELVPSEIEVVLLSPEEWAAQRDTLLRGATEKRRTLFLFDEELGDTSGLGFRSGSDIIRNLATDQPEAFGVRWFCGILSNTLDRGDELTSWQAMASEHGIMLKFFMPISKQNLQEVADFYTAVYRTLINTYCESMKELASDKLYNALSLAKKRFEQLDPIDFEHMVVKTSEEEGVSEIETVLRLYAIFQRDEVKSCILQAPVFTEFLDAAAALKGVVDLNRELPSISRERINKLRHAELYESADLINPFHDPIRNGDIFEVGDSKDLYVLIAQPCDMMVRKDGKRARENGFKVAVLVPIEDSGAERQSEGLSFTLPSFASDGEKASLIPFSKATVANLNVLDLSVLASDGMCRIKPKDAKLTKNRFPTRSWERRVRKISASFQDIASQIDGVRGKHGIEVASLFATARIPRAGLSKTLTELGTYEEGEFSYQIQRCGRIRDPLAASLLTAYSRYLSRDAFEHDFSRGDRAA